MADRLIDELRTAVLGEDDEPRFEDVTYKGKTFRIFQLTLEERTTVQEKSGMMDGLGKGKMKINLAKQAVAATIMSARGKNSNGQYDLVFGWADFEKLLKRYTGGIAERLGAVAVRLMSGGASGSPELQAVAAKVFESKDISNSARNTLRKALAGHLGAPPLVDALQSILNTEDFEDLKLKDALQSALDGVEGEALAKNESTATSGGVSGSPTTSAEAPMSGAAG